MGNLLTNKPGRVSEQEIEDIAAGGKRIQPTGQEYYWARILCTGQEYSQLVKMAGGGSLVSRSVLLSAAPAFAKSAKSLV